jgi:hypothetical protein
MEDSIRASIDWMFRSNIAPISALSRGKSSRPGGIASNCLSSIAARMRTILVSR